MSNGGHRSSRAGRLRAALGALVDLFKIDMHPACPICGHVTYIKAMPLHLSGHKVDDPDVVAWRARDRGAA